MLCYIRSLFEVYHSSVDKNAKKLYDLKDDSNLFLSLKLRESVNRWEAPKLARRSSSNGYQFTEVRVLVYSKSLCDSDEITLNRYGLI